MQILRGLPTTIKCKTNEQRIPLTQTRATNTPYEDMHHLTDSLAISKLPDRARDRIIIRNGSEISVPERLRNHRASLRVIAQVPDLLGVDVLVELAVEVDLDGDAGGQVELRVERAGAVAGSDGRGRRELVHPRRAGAGPVEALLDAVAGALDLGEGQVDLGDDAGHVEAGDVWEALDIWVLLGGREPGYLQRTQPFS